MYAAMPTKAMSMIAFVEFTCVNMAAIVLVLLLIAMPLSFTIAPLDSRFWLVVESLALLKNVLFI